MDDEIRDLFKEAKAALEKLPEGSIKDLLDKFEAFAKEFEEMIFKEEAILLMILLESLTQDDWLQIASESDAYGYAIIKPLEKWVPERQSFANEAAADTSDDKLADALDQAPTGSLTDLTNTKSLRCQKASLPLPLNPKKRKQRQTVQHRSPLATAICQSSKPISFSTICP